MGERMLKRQSRKTIAARVAKAAPVRQRRSLQAAGCQVCLGVLTGWDDRGPLVDFEGNARGPVRARLTTPGPQARAVPSAVGREVVLLIDTRPGRAPVLLGFLQPAEAEAGAMNDLEARVDGRRVEIDGRDEIVLKCGEASITLRRNGRVVIRGIQVETRAEGLNRIKGGSVSIN
jgi:Domain of unknown function (DUF6484)